MSERPDLIAEQLRHTFDLIRSELDLTKARSDHDAELTRVRLAELEEQARDYESRLRALQEAATQFKVLATLATGGGWLAVISLPEEILK